MFPLNYLNGQVENGDEHGAEYELTSVSILRRLCWMPKMAFFSSHNALHAAGDEVMKANAEKLAPTQPEFKMFGYDFVLSLFWRKRNNGKNRPSTRIQHTKYLLIE